MSAVLRGEIWLTRFREPDGSEPGFTRPTVIVQSNAFNRSAIDTVMVAVMTSNLDRGRAIGNVTITAKQSGLRKDSVINVSQVMTVDRDHLLSHLGTVPPGVMGQVNEGIKLALDL